MYYGMLHRYVKTIYIEHAQIIYIKYIVVVYSLAMYTDIYILRDAQNIVVPILPMYSKHWSTLTTKY